jgi:lipopolysaccharide transport system ATP-binding protein
MSSSLGDIVLKAEHLSKRYRLNAAEHQELDDRVKDGCFYALKDLSFELRKGDVLGIVGRNGSGKSTLLKLLSGIVHPDSGSLSYRGRLMSILDIGSGFHPELTGRENAYMFGALLGIPKQEIKLRIPQIIDFSNIGSYFDQPVKYYSNGMYLRVAFAVAFFTRTDILVLDEVLAVGDSEFMVKCHQRIREMMADGLSIILVSHSMSDIIGLCNKCLWIDKGKLAKYGSATDVVGAYLQSGWGSFPEGRSLSANGMAWDLGSGPSTEDISITGLFVEHFPVMETKDHLMDYNQAIRLSVHYHATKSTQNCSFVFIISDQYNVPIILTTHHFEQDDVYRDHVIGPGFFKSYCTIPAKLLNVGMYKVQLRVIKDNTVEVLDVNNQLFFKVKSDHPRQNSALCSTPMSIAPVFEWNTEKIGSG